MKQMTNIIRIAAVQLDVSLGAVSHNLERIFHFAREAAARGAHLVVFPECALTGYCFDSRAEATRSAESIPGPSTAKVASLCEELDVYVVFGLVEKGQQGQDDGLFNALALVGPQGVVGTYRKIHLPHLGLDRFADPGNRPLTVYHTPLCRLGMNICYDGAFPEAARVLALDGAELIVLPTNWPTGAEEFARYGVNTRALENVVYYLSANRVGMERGFRFIGTSRIVDPQGRTLAEANEDEETILVADIEPQQARVKKIVRAAEHSIDRFADRRPEFYKRVTDSV